MMVMEDYIDFFGCLRLLHSICLYIYISNRNLFKSAKAVTFYMLMEGKLHSFCLVCSMIFKWIYIILACFFFFNNSVVIPSNWRQLVLIVFCFLKEIQTIHVCVCVCWGGGGGGGGEDMSF
jgi:hypothetical protein